MRTPLWPNIPELRRIALTTRFLSLGGRTGVFWHLCQVHSMQCRTFNAALTTEEWLLSALQLVVSPGQASGQPFAGEYRYGFAMVRLIAGMLAS